MVDWQAIYAKQTLDRELVALATGDFKDFMSSLQLDRNAPLIQEVVGDFMVENVQSYGQAAASVSAEYYDATRVVSRGSSSYRAEVADIVPRSQITSSVAWAMGPLYQTDPNVFSMTRNLTQIIDRLVKQQGRDTIAKSASRDPVRTRYARILTGSRNCSFCVMLASRGAVYRTKELASSKSGSMDRYHSFCDCVATAIRSQDDYPEGYDVKELYRQYQDPKATTKAFRDAAPPPNTWVDVGDPLRKRFGTGATQRADQILDLARQRETSITSKIEEVASRNGGTMSGLDARIKSRESLARKLRSELDQRKLAGQTIDFDGLEVSDSVRYTMLLDEDNYSSGLQTVLSDLEADGFEISRVKNYWAENNAYKGVNVAVVDPQGQLFELQFHTPRSIAVKDQSHQIYEVSRATNDAVEKARLELEQRDLWAILPNPPNIETVGEIIAN